MKLKAIDIVDDNPQSTQAVDAANVDAGNNEPSVIEMPGPQGNGSDEISGHDNIVSDPEVVEPQGNGSNETSLHDTTVSDPELLELLQQLSETIDTANNVLDVATLEAGTAAQQSDIDYGVIAVAHVRESQSYECTENARGTDVES